MGLIKGKKILIDTNFTKDNYFTENTYFKAIDSTSMPTTSADVQIHNNQPVFYSINTILNRLLDNDKFINRYLDCAKSTTVSREQLSVAFNESITSITSDTFEKAFAQHLVDYHNSSDPSQIHFDIIDSNYLKADLANFNEKLARQNFISGDKDTISSANVVFENDFVTEYEFEDSSTKSSSYILASVSNSRTNKKFKYEIPASQTGGMTQTIPTLATVPYIYRKWLSGIKEFFIYLPTTFTFYHEGNGRGEDAGKDLNSDSTLIWLKFNKRHFDLHHVYSTQICGQSLPMQCTMGSTGHFSDVILPSIARSLPISQDTNDNADSIYSQNTNYFQMLFSCYGTDAQAIRMICD